MYEDAKLSNKVDDVIYSLVDDSIGRRVSSIVVFDTGVRFYLSDVCGVSFAVSSAKELIREVEVSFV